MSIYDSIIEVSLDPVFDEARKNNDQLIRQLRTLRRKHESPPEMLAWETSHVGEKALLDHFWKRARWLDNSSGATGYFGSAENCALNILYGVFGIDVLAFLFDQPWVPRVTIQPFDPELLLERLAILERAAKKLEDGAATPVVMPKATKYVRKGMGPELGLFKERAHRFFVDASLQEIREFGELGRSSRSAKDLSVDIQIWAPGGLDEDDDEIKEFAAERNSRYS